MNTRALHQLTQQERKAFGLAMARAVVGVAGIFAGVAVVAAKAMKRRPSILTSSVTRHIGHGWNDSNSIRGASLRVANE